MKKIIMILFVIVTQQSTDAQGVKIGGTGNPDATSVLELDGSSGKGLLLPRITAAQMNALNAPNGMIIYNSSDASLYLRKSNAWEQIAENTNGGGFNLPQTSSQAVDDGYLLDFTNTSVNGVNGGIKGSSGSSGYGLYGSSFTGIGGYFTSTIGPSLVTGSGHVGIGTAAPAAKVHARWTSAELLQLENTTALNPGVNVRALFKTGAFFTGAIGTTGIGSLSSRMSFFTGAVASPTSLIEKMSILNNGNVGINTTDPVSKLEVNGKTTLNQGADNAAVEIKGNIRVSGASAPAFTITCNADASILQIDHPSCNGDANAILIVTANGIIYTHFSVRYNVGAQKWEIVTGGYMVMGQFDLSLKNCNDVCVNVPGAAAVSAEIIAGTKFNVLVIKQ